MFPGEVAEMLLGRASGILRWITPIRANGMRDVDMCRLRLESSVEMEATAQGSVKKTTELYLVNHNPHLKNSAFTNHDSSSTFC